MNSMEVRRVMYVCVCATFPLFEESLMIISALRFIKRLGSFEWCLGIWRFEPNNYNCMSIGVIRYFSS